MPPTKRRTNLGRRTRNAMSQIRYQANRTAQDREDRNERERIRVRQTREARRSANNGASLNQVAFCYDMLNDYSAYNCVPIGPMNPVCQYCKAFKYKNEANGLCCANGKVTLVEIEPKLEPNYENCDTSISYIEIEPNQSELDFDSKESVKPHTSNSTNISNTDDNTTLDDDPCDPKPNEDDPCSPEPSEDDSCSSEPNEDDPCSPELNEDVLLLDSVYDTATEKKLRKQILLAIKHQRQIKTLKGQVKRLQTKNVKLTKIVKQQLQANKLQKQAKKT